MGAVAPPQPRPGWVTGLVEIRGESVGGGGGEFMAAHQHRVQVCLKLSVGTVMSTACCVGGRRTT